MATPLLAKRGDEAALHRALHPARCRIVALVLGLCSTAAFAATDPRTVPTQLPAAWQTKTREVFKQAIEIPSVHHRGQTQKVAELLASQFEAAGARIVPAG